METIHSPSIRQSESGDAFAWRNASIAQSIGIAAHRQCGSCISLQLVIEINRAGIERHKLSDLIHQYREGVFDLKGGTEFSRDFVQRIDFAMRVANFIVRRERSVLSRARHLIL